MSGLFQIGSETEATKQYSLLLTTDYEPPEPPVDPPVDPPEGFGIHSLSANHAGIGDTITITGEAFGETRGSSFVSFGEEPVTTPTSDGGETWQPCTKNAASYISWSDEEIVVTVPSMAPGAAGYPGTYHNVRVHVGGDVIGPADFYIDPVAVNPSGVTDVCWGSERWRWNQTITRTANDDTRDGIQGYDYEAPDNAYYGVHVIGHDLLFQNCTFACDNPDLNGDHGGVVTVGQEHDTYNVTFLNCTFKENWSTNEEGVFWHGVNGVKLVSDARDVVISDCTFEPHSRMSWEAIDYATPRTMVNLAVRNCVFEPPGNQAISFGETGNLYSLIEGCLFKGYGNHAVMYPGGACCWEANQARYIVTRDCEMWAGVWGQININGTVGVPRHLYFENVRLYFDAAHDYQSRHASAGSATMIEGDYITHTVWRDCVFVTGSSTKYLNSFGICTWDSAPGNWALGNEYNDFSGSTISGYVSWNGVQIPATIAGYFRGSNQHAVLASNTLPEVDNG